jgi:hypothetical protein
LVVYDIKRQVYGIDRKVAASATELWVERKGE